MHIQRLALVYNTQLLLSELNSVRLIDSTEYKSNTNWAWLKGKADNTCSETIRVSAVLQQITQCVPLALYYVQLHDQPINPHTDSGCQCAVNIVLSEQAAPVIFERQYSYHYTCALLNVGQYEHEVPAHHDDRYIVRYVFQESFDVVRDRLSQYHSN